MLDKVQKIIAEYNEIEAEFLNPEVLSDMDRMKELGKKKSKIEDTAMMSKRYMELTENIAENKENLKDPEVSGDPEMKEMIQEELKDSEEELENLEKKLVEELTPKDPNDPKDIILEIRSGAGGDEAAIFAGDLMRAYFRYAENNDFEINILNKNDSSNGGLSELVATISGKNVYKKFKYESGVHRVQRIPKTESQGRIHTSTVTVAVVPEVDEAEAIEVKKGDVRIDTYRASGSGGQHVNKTESAVRLTHIETGLVVTCQDQASQHKNKDQAFKVLAARLAERKREKEIAENSEMRVKQIGTGDRSEKIRTYNYPQDRITDHRIKQNFPNIPAVMDGELDAIIEACALATDALQ